MELTSRRKPHKQDTFPLATLTSALQLGRGGTLRPFQPPLITAADGEVGRLVAFHHRLVRAYVFPFGERERKRGREGGIEISADALFVRAALRKERAINENLIGRRAAARRLT